MQGGTGDISAPAAVAANNRFALDLYAKLRTKRGNHFLSPFSISTALGMVYAGARGKTAEQMATVLRRSENQEKGSSGVAALLQAVLAGANAGGYQLKIANGLWTERSFPFRSDFVSALRSEYGARAEEVDFAHQAEAVRAEINRWVEQQTQDKIKDLFPSGSIHDLTRLVLANAIYFKGKWSSPFKAEQTRNAPFTAPGNLKISVPTMNQGSDFRYLDGSSFQAIELPYAQGSLAMDIFLPKKADGLAEFESALTAQKLEGWLAGFSQESVRLELPKSKMTSQFTLNDTLAAMGMPLAFSTAADFTGLSPRGRELHVSLVVHKAYVEVNEEGTEAAAATGIAVPTMAARPRIRIIEFRADHPFFFLIRDVKSGAILFMGRVENPS